MASDPARSPSPYPNEDQAAAGPERCDHGRPIGEDDGKRGARGFDGDKRVKGRERCLLVDGLGLPRPSRVDPEDLSERRGEARPVPDLSPPWPTIRTVMADDGHESRALAAAIIRHEGRKLFIAKWCPRSFTIVGPNWIAERTLAWVGRGRQLAKGHEYGVQTLETLIPIAAVRLMLTRLAAR